MHPPVKFAQPWFGIRERRAVAEVLGQDILTNGDEVKAFEQEFAQWCGGGFAVAVSSCMAALHICHLILGWKACQLSPLTHVAAWHAATLAGCRPEPSHKNKSVVHYLGFIEETTRDTIEDCALAIGSRSDVHVGLKGIAGCFSFYPCKHMTTGGEGGMILTKNEHFALEARKIRSFGQCPRGTITLGMNYRMTEMQAAIGREQIKRLKWFLERRAENTRTLRKYLSEYEMFEKTSTYAYALKLENRDEIKERLLKVGVETSVYYDPIPPLTPYYREKYGFRDGDFPNAEEISRTILCLPIGPHVTPGEAYRLGETVRRVLES